MFVKNVPNKKALRYVFAFTSSISSGCYPQLMQLIQTNVIRVCVLQEEASDTFSKCRGFFTLQFPKSTSELGLYGALLKPTEKAHYLLYAMLKKHPFGETKILRGPRFDLKNLRDRKYRKKDKQITTLADLSEIEGEFSINKEIRSSLSINEDMLKELKF